MSDIVERLRAYVKDEGGWYNILETCEEAADEIERLRTALNIAKERGDILKDAIYYALEVNDDCVNWLSDWFHGEAKAMRDLDKWRKKTGRDK